MFQPRWVTATRIVKMSTDPDGTMNLGLANNTVVRLNAFEQSTYVPLPVVGDYLMQPSEGHAWSVPGSQMQAPCYCNLCPEDAITRIPASQATLDFGPWSPPNEATIQTDKTVTPPKRTILAQPAPATGTPTLFGQ